MSVEEGGAHCARNSDPCTTVPLGITPAPTGAQALRDTVARDLAANAELARRAGIMPE